VALLEVTTTTTTPATRAAWAERWCLNGFTVASGSEMILGLQKRSKDHKSRFSARIWNLSFK
jgi:hypothetical protein